jgi:N6-adenosine-specific RNA methylase IME4/ParB-like chromosome segregation protein Spo0J
MKLNPNDIVVKQGRRAIDSSKVRELAESMNQIGLLNPVTVNTNLELIAGAHRLAAAELLGWDEIEAVMMDAPDLLCELAEIDENLMRNELHYLDRGNAFKRRDELLTGAGLRAKPHRPTNAEKGEMISPLITTQAIADQMGVTARTVQQEKQIVRDILPEVQDAIKAADLPKTDALKIARLEPELQKQVADKLTTGSESFADAIREVRRDDVIERLNNVSAREVKRLEGKYDVIVIDPPWPMQKIERDVAPNQVALDYPTMTEEELNELHIPAADDCHLWLWTTHKFLPMALRLLEKWGFKYICEFVWHKPGGFQPYNLPQFNCEFAMYARKGSPEFIDTKAFNTCFNAQRKAHSEKPEEFYEVVRRVTTGTRVDMFNRRPIDGFDVWGKEA